MTHLTTFYYSKASLNLTLNFRKTRALFFSQSCFTPAQCESVEMANWCCACVWGLEGGGWLQCNVCSKENGKGSTSSKNRRGITVTQSERQPTVVRFHISQCDTVG